MDGVAGIATGFEVPGSLDGSEAKGGAKLPIRRWVWHKLKLAGALGLVGACAYAVLNNQGFVTSDNAVVSAYTVSLRAPIAGTLSALDAKIGDQVAAGEVLARLEETRVDDQRLVDLTNLLTRTRVEREAYERERDELSQQHSALLARAAERNRFEAAFLNLQVVEAERQLRAHQADRDYARQTLMRKDALGRAGNAATADVDRARAGAAQTDSDVEAGLARVAYLRVQADAAAKGILLENGSNDVAYSSQRADEVAMRLADITREIEQTAAAEAETRARLDAERRRVERLRSAELVAPSAGMVWKIGAMTGERLSVGDTAVELVDCRSAFVVETVAQDRLDDIGVGAAARIRLSGEKTDRLGRVISITGETDPDASRNVAAALPNRRTGTAVVRIEITGSDNPTSGCLIGRTARVLLPTGSGSSLLTELPGVEAGRDLLTRALHRFF